MADGCHKVQPSELGRSGQLYVCHGITRTGHQAPLLLALVSTHSKQTYKKLFKILKDQLLAAKCDIEHLKFVVDYEIGAIKAIEEVNLLPLQAQLFLDVL